jgi:tetratricopeptide (TPR) repeat protein
MSATVAQILEIAVQHHKAGRFAEAEAMYRQVLVEEPQNPDALHLLGVLAHQSGNNQAAVELIRRAIAVRPAAAYFTNLGVVLTDLRRLDEAVDAGRQAVALNPGSVEAVNNLANALREMDRLEEAVEFHRQAVVLNPNVADVHWNYAINLLALGNFAEGWPEFEWRLRAPGKNLDRGFSQPGWDGSDISDKTILLHAEGGFGDALHFVRYVPMVRRRAGRIILECQPALISLFSQIRDVDQLIARGDRLPEFDCHRPLNGLPLIFRTDLESIPSTVPYLQAPPQCAQYWKDRLSNGKGLKVGLVWAGSEIMPDRRSRSLKIFAALGEIPGVEFHSLQKGRAANDPVPSELELIDHTNELHSFADSAGMLANLDLLISVDTSAAHLAGAMARPVFTLLPFICDFRWLRGREDTPWYPTMRLFRQESNGDWNPVVRRIAEALRAKVANQDRERG